MHYPGMSLLLFATLLLWHSSIQTGCVTTPYSCQKAQHIVTYLSCMLGCCENAATLDRHYLLVVHIKINTSHAVKMLPHWTVITYLCTSIYAKSCCQNAATSDNHYLLVIQAKIHKFMLSKGCHTGQSLPTCCAHEDTHAIKMLPHWTVITYLLYTLRYTCYQKAATLDSHYLLVVHFVICQLQCKLHTGVRMNTLRLQVFLAVACECGQLHLHPGTLHVKHTPDTFEFQLF